MKLFDIIRDANQSLMRNKLRSFLTILAIFIGSFAIISTTAIQTGVNSFIDSQVDSYGGDGYIAIAAADTLDAVTSLMNTNSAQEPKEYDPDKLQTSATPISDEQIEKLKALDSIDADSIQPQYSIAVDYIAGTKNDKKYLVGLTVLPPGDINLDTTAGTKPDRNSDEAQVSLPQSYVKVLGYENDEDIIGETVTFAVIDQFTKETTEFTAKVVGVLAPGVVLQDEGYINASLGDAIYDENTKYYPEEQKNTIYMLTAYYDYDNYSDTEVKEQLEDIGLSGMTVSDIVGSVKSFFDVVLFVFKIFGAIALVAAAIGIINTLFMSVQERTREIGLDKALGMSSFRVFLSFSFEAIMLGFWGSVVGVAASMLAGYAANAACHISGGALEAFPTFSLVVYTWQDIVSITILIMAIAFLAGTLPARQAAKKHPIDALRYE